ncbi:5097_t:CDS:10 [Ambispora leptoticha]|uniref:tRNA (guanine(37)-N1)-methyltransferase n=1 Tax=Ambispora leptoticha TaxID=144679 RepID=A0A9N8ZDR2_9GLOM|nr:5097_t:CDS:10 [Ambispora leptoticha]
MIPPPIHRGMKNLQRELFRTKVELVGVRIAANTTAKFLKVLKDDLFHQPKMKNVANDPESNDARIILLKPEIQSLEQIDDANISQESRDLINQEALGFVKHTVELDYGNWGADEILKAILPEDSEVPSSFTQIGHIAHMNLRDEFLPWKEIIGQVILDKNPKIKTVVNKTDIIDTTFRFFNMEILAGINNMIAEVKEGNCRFRLDFSQVYWNSRLHSEHERLANLFKKGDYICDVFAGIGPFAVPAAKKGCIVYANDLNPVSYKYLQENSVLNKVQSKIFSYNMDGRDFIRKVVKDLHASLASSYNNNDNENEKLSNDDKAVSESKSISLSSFTDNANTASSAISAITTTATSTSVTGNTFKIHKFRTFDHFIMNLPATAIEFLDAFKGRIRLVLNEPASSLPNDAFAVHFVRSVAPNKDMYCVSFRLNANVAFGAVPSKPEISISSLDVAEQDDDDDHEVGRESKKRKVEVNSAEDNNNTDEISEIEEKY